MSAFKSDRFIPVSSIVIVIAKEKLCVRMRRQDWSSSQAREALFANEMISLAGWHLIAANVPLMSFLLVFLDDDNNWNAFHTRQ